MDASSHQYTPVAVLQARRAATGIVLILAGVSCITVNTPELPGPWTLRLLLTGISGLFLFGGIILLRASRSPHQTPAARP